MGSFFLAIPLTIFFLFVAPLWLWFHYRSQRELGEGLSQEERSRLETLTRETQQMRERIRSLEIILDAQHPTWRE
ncbi:MAG: envelope stress response membrane protein PspB [Plesiomonas sp.]|uniref:envelope stress response membrane protein PspB n=1 Tax=Plesiomonas sp. TaxID=2486279 RepID=UPI003F333B71